MPPSAGRHASPFSVVRKPLPTSFAEGVPISEVSRWLSHKSITTTVDLYGHLVPAASGRARDALDRAFARARMCPESPRRLPENCSAAGHSHMVGVSRPVGRVLCLALPRGGGHPSRAAVAGSLVRSTREHRAGSPQTLAQASWPKPGALLTLLQVGFTEPPQSPAALVVSYTTVSPLPPGHGRGRSAFCGTVPRVAPGRRYRPPCPVEPGPSSPGREARRDRPADSPAKSIQAAPATGGHGSARRPPCPWSHARSAARGGARNRSVSGKAAARGTAAGAASPADGGRRVTCCASAACAWRRRRSLPRSCPRWSAAHRGRQNGTSPRRSRPGCPVSPP
jgi:hypothetical protein